MKKNIKNEKAAVMVEAAIVFPIVLFTVFALIYLGLFKLQEMAMLYQVQRVAHQGAMAVAVPGYETLGVYDGQGIDFETRPEDVDVYYEAAHKDLLTLYREIAGCGSWITERDLQDFQQSLSASTLLLAGAGYADQDVHIIRGLFSTKVEAEVAFQFHTPGVMRFFGFSDELQYKQTAVSAAMNPAGFVRSIDLAGDACVIISEKLGIDDELGKIMDGIRKYIF